MVVADVFVAEVVTNTVFVIVTVMAHETLGQVLVPELAKVVTRLVAVGITPLFSVQYPNPTFGP